MVAEEISPQEENQPEKDHHNWPKNGHVFGPWTSDKGLPNATEYRSCIHPKCHAVERRDSPKG